jgi:O-antigen/teichoic acid export membrane protein
MGAGFFYLRTLNLGTVPFSHVWLAWGVICLSQAFGVWANIWNCVLLGVGYVGWDAVLGSLANALTLLAQIVAVLCGGGVVALATVATAGALTQRFLMLGFARNRRPEIFSIRGKFNFALVKGMMPLALRAWATAFGYTLVMSSDQFFIASFQGAKEIPAYRAAFILVINLGFASGVFAGASQVFVSHLWQAGQLEQIRILLRRNVFIGLLCMGCGGAVLIGLGSALFDLWLRPGNFVGYPVLITFLAIFAIELHANVFGFFGRATGDEAYAWTSLGSGLLKIFLAFIGIRMFGLWGLALSTLVAQGVTNSWYMVYRGAGRLKISLGEHVFKVLLPCALVFGVTLALVAGVKKLFADYSPVWQIAAGTTVAGGVLLITLWVLVLTTEHRARLLRFFQIA